MANPNPVSKPENLREPWKPGQSGNPNGYSRGRRVTDALVALIDEKGADKALAARWLREALEGDPRFFGMLLERLEGKVPDKPEPPPDEKPKRQLLLPETDARYTEQLPD